MKKHKILFIILVMLLLVINIDVNAQTNDLYSLQETDYNNLRITKQGEVIFIDDYDSCNIVLYEEVYSPINYNNVNQSTINTKNKCEKYYLIGRDSSNNVLNKGIIRIHDDPWENEYITNTQSIHYMRVCTYISDSMKIFYIEISRELIDNQYVYDFIFTEIDGNTSLPEFEFNDYMLNFFIDNFENENLNLMNDITELVDFRFYPDYNTNHSISVNKNVPASYYFENLNTNFPTNNDNSCSIIASEILLSYYDIFYNSNIVYDECYGQKMITQVNVNSPYLNTCTSSPGPSNTFDNMMKTEILSYANISLPSGDYGMTQQQINTFLNIYMSYFSDYTYENTYNIVNLNNESSILNELDNGRPIILLLTNFSFKDYSNVGSNNQPIMKNNIHIFIGGHAVVCYGYIKMNNGEVYYKCHTGFSNSYINISSTLVKSLSSISGISLRLLTYTHEHSSSYIWGGSEYCPCYLQSNYTTTLDLFSEESSIYRPNEYILIRRDEDEES